IRERGGASVDRMGARAGPARGIRLGGARQSTVARGRAKPRLYPDRDAGRRGRRAGAGLRAARRASRLRVFSRKASGTRLTRAGTEAAGSTNGAEAGAR